MPTRLGLTGGLTGLSGLSAMAGGAGFNPLSVSGCQLWLSADGTLWQDSGRTTPAAADGDRIGAWDDLSGNGRHATQATANLRHTLRISNGVKVVVSQATNMITSAFQQFPAKRGCIFVSMLPLPYAYMWTMGTSSFLIAHSTSGTLYKWYDGAQSYATAADTELAWKVEVLHRTGDTTMNFYRDLTLADTLTIQNLQPASAGFSPATNYADTWGAFREVFVYSEISDADRQSITNYMIARMPTTPKVVGFGDSITEGQGESYNHRWLNRLAINRGWTLAHNSGMANTLMETGANNGHDTYSTRVNAYNPTHVAILYGLNDIRWTGGSTPAVFETCTKDVIDGIVANGTPASQIIIGSPPYIPEASYALYGPGWNGGSRARHAQYVSAASAAASAKGTKYVDVFQWMADHGGDSLIGGDGIHPNDTGHTEIANAFLSIAS